MVVEMQDRTFTSHESIQMECNFMKLSVNGAYFFRVTNMSKNEIIH